MRKFYTIALFGFGLAGCGTQVSYLGSTYTPTRNVDVYVDASAIKRPYSVMGKGYPESNLFGRNYLEKMQRSAVQKAQERGADAVLITEYGYTVNTPAMTTINTQKDSTHFSNTVSSTGPATYYRTGMQILFLKYQ